MYNCHPMYPNINLKIEVTEHGIYMVASGQENINGMNSRFAYLIQEKRNFDLKKAAKVVSAKMEEWMKDLDQSLNKEQQA